MMSRHRLRCADCRALLDVRERDVERLWGRIETLEGKLAMARHDMDAACRILERWVSL